MDETIPAALLEPARAGHPRRRRSRRCSDASSSCPSSPRTPPRPSAAPCSPSSDADRRRPSTSFDFHSPTPDETRGRPRALREEIVSLWQTDETRSLPADRPRRGAQRPLLLREHALRSRPGDRAAPPGRAWRTPTPGGPSAVPAFLRFGSWIGGDRDGNPFVTAGGDRGDAARAPGDGASPLPARPRAAARPPEHGRPPGGRRGARGQPRGRRGALPRRGAARRPSATAGSRYRQKMAFVYRKLGATLEAEPASLAGRPPPATRDLRRAPTAFLADLRLVQDSLRPTAGSVWPTAAWGRSSRQAEIFGFHLATLDLRQHAERHTSALAEVFARYGLAAGYADWPEERARRAPDPRDPGRPAAHSAPARLQPRPPTRPSTSSA